MIGWQKQGLKIFGVLSALMLGGIGHMQGLTGDLGAHDPGLYKDGDTYYVFSTGDEYYGNGNIQIRASKDLKNWEKLGTVLPEKPDWIMPELFVVPNLWAPEVYFKDGIYYLYYAASHFGTNESAMGLLTNTTLDPKNPNYQWEDKGMVLRSKTGIDNWNAIDPARLDTSDGRSWLAFGSFWDGIKMRELDPKTGLLLESNQELYKLASRGGGAIEAPALIERDGYYYLFVSFDRCCAGLDSTYKMMVGRSKSITGPYLDKNGNDLANGGGSLLLETTGRFVGPGGQSVYQDGNRYLLAHHYYDGDLMGTITLQVTELQWDDNGWPEVNLKDYEASQ
ncbi:arabinan endo-1,5-alpha-L-arabinosidase [Deinococcus cellulosilyticus]|uniref:Arabinan endo-1,5-alpha-L-arabinosidase n=1 Tax=Deinococcus cellulosilyticus (strain DSM 18568 / NBRC 106333 / KACC 11606 / 5516J-15) TaxID=1223518 RepID=A0A511N1P4_DEIC1|nr:arabinan endo-1,5-alpha-L-arabinosidase [Deinococcus cellulosilyticus]GEM46782.1 arabinan endo-1,5-alpha-L-arabinosidase [Deinococcus cellulosilyticus NBRC 106333 = KACC 11606]